MASELAHAAKNDRWHHTAASRALVDQLLPHGYAAASSGNGHASGLRFRKSLSSVEMTDCFAREFVVFGSSLMRLAWRNPPGRTRVRMKATLVAMGKPLERRMSVRNGVPWSSRT